MFKECNVGEIFRSRNPLFTLAGIRGFHNTGIYMTQSYTKQQINSTRTIGKDEDFSKKELRKYQGYARIIPAHINDDESLTDSQKMLYGLLEALSHNPDHFGYCFSTNELLGKITNKRTRTLQRNLEKLQKKGLIIVEISQKIAHKSIRRIWTLENFSIRNRLEKIYGEDKFNQRFYTHVKSDMSSCQKCHTYIAKEDVYLKNNTKVLDKTPRAYNKDQATKNKNNTKVLDKTPQIPKKEQKTTAPPAPIIPLFCYEWKNPKTGLFQKVENGITNEEFENLKTQIGEERIRCVCQSMVKYAENNKGTILFKNKNLYNKIIEWDRRASEADKDREQKKKEKELRGGVKEFDQEQGGVDPHKCNDSKIVKNFIDKNPDLKNDIRIFENKIEIRNPLNKRIFGQILIPEPLLNQKLERWAKEFRENRK